MNDQGVQTSDITELHCIEALASAGPTLQHSTWCQLLTLKYANMMQALLCMYTVA